MNKSKIFVAFILTFVILISQFGVVFATPASKITLLTGTVQSITLETDTNTGVTTVLVTVLDENNASQIVRINVKNATKLGLITNDENGTPAINPSALGKTIQIDPKAALADNGVNQNPVADALATFFSGTTDYETIMQAHNEGFGYGVIAQALWLTDKLKGTSADFLAILNAKETGDFSAFILQDGSTPTNWGQFKKAVLDGDKIGNLGVVMAPNHNKNGNGHNGNNNHPGSNHGNGNNGNGNGK